MVRRSRSFIAILTAVAAVAAVVLAAQVGAQPARAATTAASGCPWVGSAAPTETKVSQVVAQMNLDEKITMLGLSASPDG